MRSKDSTEFSGLAKDRAMRQISYSYIAVIAAALMFSACAKENSNNPGAGPVAPFVTPDPNGGRGLPNPPPSTCTSGPCTGGYTSGSTAQLRLTGSTQTAQNQNLSTLFYNSYPNSPTNLQINIDLTRPTDAVIVSYMDGGRTVEAAFGTRHPYNPQVSGSTYNKWYTQNNQQIWKGFFQDSYGAAFVIIDRAVGQGDGTPPEFIGGSVWFQNFNKSYPNNPQQGPLLMCWQITLGPYDCRSFIVGMGSDLMQPGSVNMLSSLFPNNIGRNASMQYQKLGEFDGIGRVTAGF
jgi:hypothetical protein